MKNKHTDWKKAYFDMKEVHEFIYLSLLEFVRNSKDDRFLFDAINAAKKMTYHKISHYETHKQ